MHAHLHRNMRTVTVEQSCIHSVRYALDTVYCGVRHTSTLHIVHKLRSFDSVLLYIPISLDAQLCCGYTGAQWSILFALKFQLHIVWRAYYSK
jgi:hypothetical protein